MRESEYVAVVTGRFAPVVARGLAELLGDEPQLRLVGRDLGHSELERALRGSVSHVAIVDDATERALRESMASARSDTAIVVLSRSPSLAYGTLLLGVGASCVSSCASTAEIAAAVLRTARGERLFVRARGETIQHDYPTRLESLTKRERQVLVHLSKGASYSEVAYELKIGVRTVETHAGRVRRKLGARRKRDLVGLPMPADQRAV